MAGIAEIGIRVFLDNVAAGGLAQLASQLMQVQNNTHAASAAMKEMQAAAMSGALVGFGLVLVGVGAAVKYSIDAATEFQTALYNMAVATHVPLSEAQGYTKALMDLGSTSTFTTAEIVQGISALGRSGFTLHDIMTQTGKDNLSMAQVGIMLSIAIGTDAVSGFKLLAQTMSAYHAPSTQALQDANLLQYAFEHQRGSVADFATGMSQVTPEAARFHVGLNEIGPALDIVSSSMASTGRAGTALRYMLDGIYSPTAAGQKEMVKLGLASTDASGKFHSAFFDAKGNAIDFMAAVTLLKDKLSHLTQEDQIQALHNLFSVRGGQGVEVTLNQFDKLSASMKQLSANANNAGMVQQRFKERMEQLGPSTQALQTSLVDLAATVGLAIIPAITKAIQWINGIVSGIRVWASQNSAAIPSLLGMIAAVAGVGFVIAAVLILIANPVIAIFIGALVAAVAASVGLAVALQRIIPWFQQLMAGSSATANIIRFFIQVLQQLWTEIVGAVMQAFASITSMMRSMGVDFTGLATLGKFLAALLGALAIVILGVLVAAIMGLVRALAFIIVGLALVATGIVQWVAGIVQVFHGFFQMLIGLVTGNQAMMTAGWHNFWQGWLNILRGAWMIILGVIVGVGGAILGFIMGFVQGIINWFQHLSTVLVGHSIIPDMMNAILQVFVSVWNQILAFIGGIVSNIIGRFTAFGAQAVAALTAAFNAMRAIVTAVLQGILALIMGNMAQAQASFSAAWSAMQALTNAAWNAIRNAVVNGVNNAVSFIQSLPGRIQSVLGGLAGQMYSWGATAMQQFANGLASTLGAVVQQVQNAASQVANFLAHHSPAKYGPLSDDDQWMPNMMNMFANDIKRHGPLLTDALSGVTGNLANVPSVARTTNASSYGGGQVGGNVYATINLDGNPVAQVVINKLTGQLQTAGIARILH